MIGKSNNLFQKKRKLTSLLRLIVDLAVMRNGVILSNDFYRDLLKDSGDAVGKAIRER
jgi:hypothetical protein